MNLDLLPEHLSGASLLAAALLERSTCRQLIAMNQLDIEEIGVMLRLHKNKKLKNAKPSSVRSPPGLALNFGGRVCVRISSVASPTVFTTSEATFSASITDLSLSFKLKTQLPLIG